MTRMSEIEYKRTRVDEDCDELRRGNAHYSTPKEDAVLIGITAAISIVLLSLIAWLAWRMWIIWSLTT